MAPLSLSGISGGLSILAQMFRISRSAHEEWSQGHYRNALEDFAHLRDSVQLLEQDLRRHARAAGVPPSTVAALLNTDERGLRPDDEG